MLLIGAFVLSMITLCLVAENETLEEMATRREINRMADRSRTRKAPGMRRRWI